MPELMSRGNSGGRRRRAPPPMSQINVTPFVDVMLVLLIVFMVTAPLLTVGVPVNLPRAQAPNISEPEEPMVVTVVADGRVYVQESEVALPNLVPLLVEVTGANPDVRIFVRGDRQLVYGRIMEVMGAIAAAGFSRVSLVAEMPPDRARGE